VLVELGDGSTDQLDTDACRMADMRSVRRVINVSTSIAQVLVIAPQSRGPKREFTLAS
jgi:hypothetical protein